MGEEIRYLCLSDLHLGAASSLFTSSQNDIPRRASRILIQFAVCLRILAERHSLPGRRPTLILNGDIIEMALADVEDALSVLHDFLGALFPPNEKTVFDREILYLPGNHDHHIWELAREEEMARRMKRRHLHTLPSFHTLAPDSKAAIPCSLLSSALNRTLRDISIKVIYPNLSLSKADRSVIIHHGHFTEGIYYQISNLRDLIFPGRTPPRTVEAIEAENFAWIDFLWSTLGRSGAAGQDLELLYEKAQDEGEIEKIIYRFAVNVTARSHPPSFFDRLKALFVYLLIRTAERTLIGTEVRQTRIPLSRSSWKTLVRYMSGPVKAQITGHARAYASTAFLFGHTHKPFREARSIPGFRGQVSVHNSGGWVIETPISVATVGGDIILLDGDLNPVSIPIFRDKPSSSGPATELLQAGVAYAATMARPEWQKLLRLIDEGIKIRRDRLIHRIQSDGSIVARFGLWTRRKQWKSILRNR